METEPQNLPHAWQRFSGLSLAEYRGMDGNRAYALTDQSKLSLGALLATIGERHSSGASTEVRREFRDAIKRVSRILPDTNLLRKTPDDVEIPTIPKDPVSGLPVRNPWEEPVDVTSQSLLEKHHPLTAAYFRSCIGGPTYKYVAEFNKKVAEAKKAQTLVYTAVQHSQNPFVKGVTPAPELVKQLRADPALSELYQTESKLVRLPWSSGHQNMSELAIISNVDPSLSAIVEAARQVETIWVNDMLQAAAAMVHEAKALAGRLPHPLTSTTAEQRAGAV